MAYYLKLYLATLVAFLAIDMIWLGLVARTFYRKHLVFLLAPTTNWIAAIVFYLLFILGILVFVVVPGLEDWGMRFIWTIKAEYLIISLNEDYTQTVIGSTKRDFVWIMARTPVIPEEDYSRIVAYLSSQGYDITKLQKVPQRWPEKRE